MTIKEVKSKAQLSDFLTVPHTIYQHLDNYVHPLSYHMKMLMGRLGSPQKHFFVAYDGSRPVARLGAKVHEHNGKKYLHFGFFECHKGYPDAVKALFNQLRTMYPDLPIRGPYHFRLEDPFVGVLAEGFERKPSFLMTYNPDYYASYLADAGLNKLMDLFTYTLDTDYVPPKIAELASKAHTKGVKIRWMNPKNVKDEVRSVVEIFNDALSQNWGYEEFIDEQVKEMYTMFKLFIDPRIVAFAQVDGKDVGCLLMLPNYNPILKSSQGRVTPSLIWKFLRGRRQMSEMRGYALGVKRDFHGYGIGSALTEAMYQKCLGQTGYRTCEISWVLASNGPMNELAQAMEGKKNKVYRIFEAPV